MISILYDYINTIIIFFSLVFGIKYLIQNEGLLALKILGIQLLINFIFLSLALFVNPVDLLKYPYLLGYLKPMVYIFPILTFLFHYYLLRPGEKFKPYFLLFFIPYLISMVENIPYFISSTDVKLDELKLILEKKDYFYRSAKFIWIAPLFHIYANIFIYMLTGIFLLKDFITLRAGRFFVSTKEHPFVSIWLFGILFFRLVTIVYTLYTFVFSYSPRLNYSGLELMIVGDSIFCILFLLCNPNLLDVYYFKNFIQELHVSQQKSITKTKEGSIEFHGEYEHMYTKVHAYLLDKKPFLDPDFTVEKLSYELKIPQRVISIAIKHMENSSVKDYINKKRMEYLIHSYQSSEKVRNYSFDYLAEMAGFGSRQTFYSCSQKFYQCSPKDLFEKSLIQHHNA